MLGKRVTHGIPKRDAQPPYLTCESGGVCPKIISVQYRRYGRREVAMYHRRGKRMPLNPKISVTRNLSTSVRERLVHHLMRRKPLVVIHDHSGLIDKRTFVYKQPQCHFCVLRVVAYRSRSQPFFKASVLGKCACPNGHIVPKTDCIVMCYRFGDYCLFFIEEQ